MTKTIIPEKSFGGNNSLLRKSESLETNTDLVSFDSEANFPFAIPLSAYLTENPFDSRKFFTAFGIFSSSRNFGEFNITSPAKEFSGIFNGSSNMFSSNRRVVFKDFFHGLSDSDQLKDITNQDPGSSESGLTMADFTVRNKVIINLNSHNQKEEKELFKDFDENLENTA